MNKIDFLKENKNRLFENYLKSNYRAEPRIVIFMAGASGAGKTEYCKSRILNDSSLLHLDTDEIRDFFAPIGYNGTNASEFQQVASKSIDLLFKEAISRELNVILDTNFSKINLANINIQKALKHQYIVEIVYILQKIEQCLEFAKAREITTKRVVPKDIIVKSLRNSFDTVLQVKEIFGDRINLILIDRIEDKIYEDIDTYLFFEKARKEIL